MQQSDFTNIDEYIEMFPKDVQAKLGELRQAIHEAASEAMETISYRMPAFKLHSKGLVYFGAFKEHIGFYPFPSGVVEFDKMTDGLYTSGKGTIQFPLDKPMPLDLVKKIVEFRVDEVMEASKKGSGRKVKEKPGSASTKYRQPSERR